MMTIIKPALLFLSLSLLAIADDAVAALPTAVPGAKHFLKRYPSADANSDGVLTKEEQTKFNIAYTIEKLGGDYTYQRVMMPMRDGIKLHSAVFLPKEKGPHATVLTRTAYGVWAANMFEPQKYANQRFAFVTQDLRGDEESEGQGTADLTSFDNEIEDGYDTIDWIVNQEWSNGKVGITGQSGHGFSAYMAYLANHPNLTAADTNVSGGSAHLYWTYHNGVRREMYTNWLASRGIHTPAWPRPGIEPFDRSAYAETVKTAAVANDAAFIAKTGWYDIFAESALDYFRDFAKEGKVFVQVDASGHGGMRGHPYPPSKVPEEWTHPTVNDVLNDGDAGIPDKSRLVYYLMGDCVDKDAPGNHYKVTDVWPVPHTPTPYYFHENTTLDTAKPISEDASFSYLYDPKNPVKSEGGDVFIHQGVGPKDQRPVYEGRSDILRFQSAPLLEPMEITGKVLAELYVSSSVPDTTFTAKLVDIYPDGHEAIVRDSIIMGRYHAGFDKEVPMTAGQVYKLTMDMWSTAIVINKGHRLGVHISSSNAPKYEVHPNSFESVTSMKDAPVAKNTLHLSKEHPSHIILPIVK